MSQIFDTILVGAGPCALAALSALDRAQRLAVITGAEPVAQNKREIHPKIGVVALERGEKPGVTERLDSAAPGGIPLFTTATTGGLANYWGQQFVRYGRHDPLPADLFTSYETYQQDCTAIEKLFATRGGMALPKPAALPADYTLLSPRLMMGTTEAPESGLLAMRLAVEAALPKATVVTRRVQTITRRDADLWDVHLSDGSIMTGHRIGLAAGVLGTARIILRSMGNLTGVSFHDHVPYMAYASGLRALLPPQTPHHFNALTLEKV